MRKDWELLEAQKTNPTLRRTKVNLGRKRYVVTHDDVRGVVHIKYRNAVMGDTHLNINGQVAKKVLKKFREEQNA